MQFPDMLYNADRYQINNAFPLKTIAFSEETLINVFELQLKTANDWLIKLFKAYGTIFSFSKEFGKNWSIDTNKAA